jgi:hypothetical protein
MTAPLFEPEDARALTVLLVNAPDVEFARTYQKLIEHPRWGGIGFKAATALMTEVRDRIDGAAEQVTDALADAVAANPALKVLADEWAEA